MHEKLTHVQVGVFILFVFSLGCTSYITCQEVSDLGHMRNVIVSPCCLSVGGLVYRCKTQSKT